jgi:hypothetical protein
VPPKNPAGRTRSRTRTTSPVPGHPQFGQPAPSPDPTGFRTPVTDSGGDVTPMKVNPTLTLENHDDTNYGYLRIVVDTQNLRIEYHSAADGAGSKTPNDTVTVNLKTRAVT